VYRACAAGARPAAIVRDLARAGIDPPRPGEVRELLDGLVAAHVMYHEDGEYLALAIRDGAARRPAVAVARALP
jgi:hypothetical protein